MKDIKAIVDDISKRQDIGLQELQAILQSEDIDGIKYLRDKAAEKAKSIYGNKVFIRGLIEFTNYCKNDCYYCGIRHGNHNAQRYRLSDEQIFPHVCASGR